MNSPFAPGGALNPQTLKQEWFGNLVGDVLSGLVVAVALIPEAIGFSMVIGVDPMVGLYASFCIAIVTAFLGGRTGMISAATGSMAMVMVLLVRDYGIEYMFAATIMCGVFQILLGAFKVGNLLRFIPRPVSIGFVNALAIMIFESQLGYFEGADWTLYVMVAVGIAAMFLWPKVTTKIPAGLVVIVAFTACTIGFGWNVLTVGDLGNITGELPSLHFPLVPLTFETLTIITPYALSLAIVGLSESLMTAQLIDERVDNKSNKNRECVAQGVANIVAALFGGQAGCAMIGQSMINISGGGRGRLSTFIAGFVLLILVLVLAPFVRQIPAAALIAIMVVVSFNTFDWKSIPRIMHVDKGDTVVMVATVAVVLITSNLAYGVVLGIAISAIVFANKASQRNFHIYAEAEGDTLTFYTSGQLFFASTERFLETFDMRRFKDSFHENVVFDLTDMVICDESAVDAIDKAVTKFRESGAKVEIVGMSEQKEAFYTKMSRVWG